MNMQALFDGFAGVVVSVGEAINTAGLDENDQETDEASAEFIETFGEVVEDVVEDSDSNIDTIAMLIER
jgi:hypothetical protein